ncbi:peptidyl-dipeptidase Dcp [Sphingomonas sp. SORGH_AS802]|uniref:M3 family metallopeptidase n=1 Tax=unclassified Sphingomonas TaxID=196159 RepID=UPI0028661CDE|nr:MULTISPECIES: M3 family metallopeptidase [unclassified Sphingomonas]MDR6126632.1 peptidyl-dipeptidase Dcp [Sphingomonas sp. SORGH_AS_0438]MDR6135000.1 peptidyl-dipeptidase Dcp [Sphingomonas sp. SORGH_AS_0802]
MTRSLLLRSCAAACLLAACITAAAADAQSARVNPLTVQSDLPFQAPRFDRIQDSDYQPAIERGIAEQAAEMTRIANDPAAPTFDNTIVAMERSGRILDRAAQAFSAVVGANTNPTLDKVQEAVAPKLAAHSDSIFLNPRLFARVKSLYDRRAALKLTPEQAQVLDITYNNFIHAGAKLSAADQAKLRVLNGKLSTLETAFQQKLLAAAKGGALVVDDKARLVGLDDAQIAAAGQAAQERGLTGKYLLPLQNTTQQPMLQSLTDRATRQALFDASWTRAERGDVNDTRSTIVQLADLRAQKAQLLGYPNFAAYVLYDQMAKTPQAAKAFMQRLIPATAAEQKREAAEIQKVITANGGDFALKPWDWDRYAEMVRKAKYDLDENEVKPYFEINRVLQDGVFYAANQLYGLTFKERKDLPVYQPDVRVFTVYDQDGSELGVMYFDYWKRDNKNGGAWMSNFVGQSKLLGTKPVIYNVANFTKPAPGQPALISFDDVTTMFHEFGHALHGLFANQTYPTVSGTNTARDWVEFPSQFNEHWALDPKVLAHYAKDYRTGAPMPAALVTKVKNAAKFNQGYALGELIASAMLDQDWHSLPASAGPQDVDAFEAKSLAEMGLDTADVPPRYRSSYFLHIWANGYAAGYYAYLWTQMLDDDAYSWFEKHGGMTRANGQRFRDMILSKGHSEDYGPMFRAFYGKDPDIGPMLEDRGLAGTAN